MTKQIITDKIIDQRVSQCEKHGEYTSNFYKPSRHPNGVWTKCPECARFEVKYMLEFGNKKLNFVWGKPKIET